MRYMRAVRANQCARWYDKGVAYNIQIATHNDFLPQAVAWRYELFKRSSTRSRTANYACPSVMVITGTDAPVGPGNKADPCSPRLTHIPLMARAELQSLYHGTFSTEPDGKTEIPMKH